LKKGLILALVLGLMFFLLGEGIVAAKEQPKPKTKAAQVNPGPAFTSKILWAIQLKLARLLSSPSS